MLTVEEAVERVAQAAAAVRPAVETVATADAIGRVLAEDVAMDHDVPPFHRAMMDGYAVRATDVRAGADLDVAQEVLAGDWPSTRVVEGAAARIMTGAPVPDGAERVVPFEWTSEDGKRVRIERVPSDAAHIAARGSHVREGDAVLRRGSVLSAAALGVLASAGVAAVPVARKPRVAVLGTGTELVSIDETPGPGRIRNSNNAVLCGQLCRAGAGPVDLGFARDDEDALREAIRGGLAFDGLLLTGGVSKGDKDLVPGMFAAEGVEQHFHRWAVQPGGPLWFGARGATLVFGLPGNPAASFVGFEVLVAAALEAYAGRPVAPRPTFKARYDGPWGKPGPRRRYRPVRLRSDDDGGLRADALPWKGSGDPFGLAAAEALVAIPENDPAPEGEVVLDVLPVAERR